MTELEKLLEQRKELDKRIKALKCPKYEVDGARLFVVTRNGEPLDRWVVTVEQIGGRTSSYKELIGAKDKQECIEGLETLIHTLQELYDKVTEVPF